MCPGTRLTAIAFSEDTNFLPADVEALYEYLTGDAGDRFYRSIVSPEAVHCMLISAPDEVVDALRAAFGLDADQGKFR